MAGVAIMGYGVVGSGVAEILDKHPQMLSARAGQDIYLKYILDVRDFPDSPFADKMIKDFSIIENDPEVSIVVETIGGSTFAYDFTKRALLAGKHVITSNKELVAKHAVEFFSIAADKNVNYLFEASVGGGIPIIRPLNQCLAANKIEEVYGILNGTTNYILTRMIQAGLPFEDALKEAQALGYAEANPSADIHGDDACRKICILSALAFGTHVYPDMVKIEGIQNVALEDIALAEALGRKIKLLGRSKRLENDQLYISVSPYMIPATSPLATIDGVFNGIMVKGDSVDEVLFYGRGAGKLPTASAIVADVIDAAKHDRARKWMDWEPADAARIADCRQVEHEYCVRVAANADEVYAKAREIFGEITVVKGANVDGFVVPSIAEGIFFEKLDALKAACAEGAIANKMMLF
ncbi:MAG: homoserine dehydrogenase [Clostridia bacterium]|nr:homoserine dehydrogenase [Clostridia bacterium]